MVRICGRRSGFLADPSTEQVVTRMFVAIPARARTRLSLLRCHAVRDDSMAAPSSSKVELQKGEQVQFFDTHAKLWVDTVISEVDPATLYPSTRYKVACKSAWQRDLQKLRPPTSAKGMKEEEDMAVEPTEPTASPVFGGDDAADGATASASEVGGVVVLGRDRGEADDALSKLVHEWITQFGSVSAIMSKFEETYGTVEEKIKVKARMLGIFSKEARKGACFAKFQSAPGSASFSGHVHPCMLCFRAAAWKQFFVYESDFIREVQYIWQHGLENAGLELAVVSSGDGSEVVGQFEFANAMVQFSPNASQARRFGANSPRGRFSTESSSL